MSYWSLWRAAHPAYRAREAERSRRRKAQRGDRHAEYARRHSKDALLRARAAGDNGSTATDHPILAAARRIVERVIRPDRRSVLYRPTFEDATSDTVVALLSGEDPEAAARDSVKDDRTWLWRTRYGDTVLLSDQDGPLIWVER